MNFDFAKSAAHPNDIKETSDIKKLPLMTKEDFRRNSEALARKALRLSEKKKESECQMDSSKC